MDKVSGLRRRRAENTEPDALHPSGKDHETDREVVSDISGGTWQADGSAPDRYEDPDDYSTMDDEALDRELAALEKESLEKESLEKGAGVHDDPAATGSSPVVPERNIQAVTVQDNTGSTDAAAGDAPVSVRAGYRPVPRISIAAFCETSASADLLERASKDRRMLKAQVDIHTGGIPEAVERYRSASTPGLVLLETMEGGETVFEQLREFAEVCDSSTKVVIIGQVNDIVFYRELMRQGISEYVVRPDSPLKFIELIADLYVDPSAAPPGKTFAFMGTRGGTGSSSVAHNVAWSVAEHLKTPAVIVDFDLAFGTAALDFDQEPASGLFDALTAPERVDTVLLDRLMQKITDNLSLLTAPCSLKQGYDIESSACEVIADVIRGSIATVIIDIPHVWTDWSRKLLTSADEIVFTATPDLASFRNLKNILDVVKAERANDAPPDYIINQYSQKTAILDPAQFEQAIGYKPKRVLEYNPRLFSSAATEAVPVFKVQALKSSVPGDLQSFAAELTGYRQAEGRKSGFSFSSLFGGKK